MLVLDASHVAVGVVVFVALYIGVQKLLAPRRPAEPVAEPFSPTLTDPDKFMAMPLVEKRIVSHDTRIFRFGLPSKSYHLGLPIGQHIWLKAEIDGKDIMRAYTPITSDDDKGYFEVCIKVYFANVHPKFPEGGKMSQHLEKLNIGDKILVRGPHGRFEYKGKGEFVVKQSKDKFVTHKVKRMAMLAGGTGITPILQIIRAVLRDPEDRTEMWLLFANQTEQDILLREELEACTKDSRFHLSYTVDRPPEGWTHFSGFINLDMITKALPDPTEEPVIALMCGPPPMITHACKPNLAARGYSEEQMFNF